MELHIISLWCLSRGQWTFWKKYAERTEDGDIKIESIGLYKNYTISIGTIDDAEMYDKLIDHITDCENRFHHVSLPDASKQFDFMGIFLY